MNSILKPFGILLATAALCATLAKADDKPAAASSDAKANSQIDDLFPDPVAVRGKGFEIKRSRFDADMINAKAEALSKVQELTPNQITVLERRVLDELILDQILLSKATAADKAKGREEGDKQFEKVKKSEPNEETFVRQLRAFGLTLDKYHNRLIEKATVQPMLRAKASITDAQVKKFYDDNPSKFEEPEMVDVSYILMNTADPNTGAALSDDRKKAKEKQLEELLKRARAGEDFTKLARQFSEDSGVKQNDGEIKFARNSPRIPPEFEAAAFSLKTNQISDVVSTMYGYCIIQLHKNIAARKVPFSETSKPIEDYLVQVQVEKMLPQYYVDLKKEVGVEIPDKELKAIEDIPAAEQPGGSSTNATSSPGK